MVKYNSTCFDVQKSEEFISGMQFLTLTLKKVEYFIDLKGGGVRGTHFGFWSITLSFVTQINQTWSQMIDWVFIYMWRLWNQSHVSYFARKGAPKSPSLTAKKIIGENLTFTNIGNMYIKWKLRTYWIQIWHEKVEFAT